MIKGILNRIICLDTAPLLRLNSTPSQKSNLAKEGQSHGLGSPSWSGGASRRGRSHARQRSDPAGDRGAHRRALFHGLPVEPRAELAAGGAAGARGASAAEMVGGAGRRARPGGAGARRRSGGSRRGVGRAARPGRIAVSRLRPVGDDRAAIRGRAGAAPGGAGRGLAGGFARSPRPADRRTRRAARRPWAPGSFGPAGAGRKARHRQDAAQPRRPEEAAGRGRAALRGRGDGGGDGPLDLVALRADLVRRYAAFAAQKAAAQGASQETPQGIPKETPDAARAAGDGSGAAGDPWAEGIAGTAHGTAAAFEPGRAAGAPPVWRPRIRAT